ncbi:MAG: hypothetical protein ACXADY_06460 [Candidatus Hodarchaeales archaeon]
MWDNSPVCDSTSHGGAYSYCKSVIAIQRPTHIVLLYYRSEWFPLDSRRMVIYIGLCEAWVDHEFNTLNAFDPVQSK